MASTESTMTEMVVQRIRTKYHWPPVQLNFWILIMLIGSATILGIFSSFVTVQNQLRVGIPWYVSSTLLGLCWHSGTADSELGKKDVKNVKMLIVIMK